MKLPTSHHAKSRFSSHLKQGFVVVGFFVLAAVVVTWTTLGQSSAASAPNLVHWQTDYAGALKQARATGKPVLLDFAADWCGPCQVMQQQVYSQPKAANFINTYFIPVKVDMTNTAKPVPLAQQLRVWGLPTLVIQSPQGKVTARQAGYQGKTMMLAWLATHSKG